jgi:hypothetical protein
MERVLLSVWVFATTNQQGGPLRVNNPRGNYS